METIILNTIQGVTNLAAAVAVPVCGLGVLIGGIRYGTPSSSPKASEEGKTIAVRSLIGMLGALGATAIVATVRGWTGL